MYDIYYDVMLLYIQAFGSPTIIAHVKKPVMLFGSDRFPILAQILRKLSKYLIYFLLSMKPSIKVNM